jgi:tRNA modification GTPase
MLVKFQEPNSFTGENVVEFHVHGSVAIVKKLLEVLNGFEFFRSAESGEFTKR